jgi:hypothetical protein
MRCVCVTPIATLACDSCVINRIRRASCFFSGCGRLFARFPAKLKLRKLSIKSTRAAWVASRQLTLSRSAQHVACRRTRLVFVKHWKHVARTPVPFSIALEAEIPLAASPLSLATRTPPNSGVASG